MLIKEYLFFLLNYFTVTTHGSVDVPAFYVILGRFNNSTNVAKEIRMESLLKRARFY